MHGWRQREFLQPVRAPRMSAVPAQVKQDEFCGTLLKALNDLGRVGMFGGPQEQIKMLRQQDSSAEVDVLLRPKISEGLCEVTAETVEIKPSGTAVGAGREEMRVTHAVAVALARHAAILQRRTAHIAKGAMYAPPAQFPLP